MAALDFPDSPTPGQVFDKWTWNGTMWVLTPVSGGGGGGSGFTFNQDAQPTATKIGDTWFETDTGDSFVWTNDGNSTQWVQFAPGSGGSNGTGGVVGYARLATSQAGITTTTDVTGLTATFIADPTHTYKITAELHASSSVAGDTGALILADGDSAQVQLAQSPLPLVSTNYKLHGERVITGASGSLTYKVRYGRATGTGTHNVYGGGAAPAFLLVEDITYGASGGGGGGGGGSGFTFVQEALPVPTQVGDTWFDTGSAATGGTSWVAVEEGAAGSEKVWVQFAPGAGASSSQGMTLIQDIRLTATTASVSFDVPQTFTSLRLYISARSDGPGNIASVAARFNSDTGNNYDLQQIQTAGTTVVAMETLAANFASFGLMTFASGAGNLFSQSTIDIPFYRDGVTNRQWIINSVGAHDYATGTRYARSGGGGWKNSADITKIDLFPQPTVGGNFVAKSRFTLYGIA